ncbi:MAG: hypothetical protein U5K37_12785 [Natrialbaceae archaeon]|nr:hypothetical protein [Natrialbaceae archaeon]
MLAGEDQRHIVVTATAGTQIEREAERAGIDADDYAIQPILPEKFRDYIFSLYPELESVPLSNQSDLDRGRDQAVSRRAIETGGQPARPGAPIETRAGDWKDTRDSVPGRRVPRHGWRPQLPE